MRNVKIVCIGGLKEKYWREACDEYTKRLSAFCRFTICELPESRLPDTPPESIIKRALTEEGAKILAHTEKSLRVAMCIEGRELSSPELAAFTEKSDMPLSFIIGSSYGLAEEVKAASALRLSMSPMTFPHQLARVMLCEQIYRAFQIMNNGKYHK